MHLDTHHRSPSGVAARILLLLALAAASLTLTHCRMVGDRLTGVQVSPLSRRHADDCVKKCREQFKDDSKAEEREHHARVNNCNRDHDCLRAEAARHDDAEDIIERAYRTCRNECHHQGGGGDR